MKHASVSEFVDKVQTWDPRKQGAGTTLRYIDIGSVSQTEKVIENPPTIQAEEAPSRARQIVKAGDILISTVRPNLNAVALVPDDLDGATASTGFSILRPDDAQLNRNYLFHWVRTQAFISEMMRQATGQSYPAVSDKIVKASQIPLPPLEEQRRIAGILDQADALRRLRTRALDKLNTLGQAIFHQMFGRSGDSENDIIDLGSMLTFVTSGGRGWAKYYSEEGARFLRSLDVQMNAIGDDDIAYVVPPDNAEARRTRVEKGDVLLTITGSKIGRSAALPDELAGSYISQHVAILRPDLDRVLPTFLSYFLSMEQFGQKQIKAKQYGQAKPGLNFEQIRSFQIPNVSIERQRELVGRLNDVAKAHSASVSGKEKFEALFTSLQNRAFRGQL